MDKKKTEVTIYVSHKGINIPEELAIIGFNSDPVCDIIDPLHSIINHPAEEMGETAVQQALLMLEQNNVTETRPAVTLNTHVAVRASSDRTAILSAPVNEEIKPLSLDKKYITKLIS